MKARLFLLVALLVLAYAPAHAQLTDRSVERAVPAGPGFSPATAALTRQMATRLQINEGQYIKLYNVNRTRQAQLAEINTYFKADEAGRTARLAELDAQYEQECSRILSAQQLSQLHESSQPAIAAPAPNGRG